MSRLEHCYENAITAIEDGKDYDTWKYEEMQERWECRLTWRGRR